VPRQEPGGKSKGRRSGPLYQSEPQKNNPGRNEDHENCSADQLIIPDTFPASQVIRLLKTFDMSEIPAFVSNYRYLKFAPIY